MTATVEHAGGILQGSAVPARKEPDAETYRGRVSRHWIQLRAGRDVEAVAAAVRKAGVKCSRATYYNWESGETDPPIAALPAIAKALGVKVADLFPAK